MRKKSEHAHIVDHKNKINNNGRRFLSFVDLILNRL